MRALIVGILLLALLALPCFAGVQMIKGQTITSGAYGSWITRYVGDCSTVSVACAATAAAAGPWTLAIQASFDETNWFVVTNEQMSASAVGFNGRFYVLMSPAAAGMGDIGAPGIPAPWVRVQLRNFTGGTLTNAAWAIMSSCE